MNEMSSDVVGVVKKKLSTRHARRLESEWCN